jgi:drug/metabolite transporter (DMT)-like permease
MVPLAVSVAGVLLGVGHEAGLQGPDAAKGTLLVFLSAASYAVYLVYSGELVKRLGSLRLVGLATSAACLFVLLQFALMRPLNTAFAVAPEVIQLSVLNAVACTFAPVLMVMMGIERIGAGLAAQTGMIGPMSTILMGVVILGEPFNGWILVGTVLVMGGVYLVTRFGRIQAK